MGHPSAVIIPVIQVCICSFSAPSKSACIALAGLHNFGNSAGRDVSLLCRLVSKPEISIASPSDTKSSETIIANSHKKSYLNTTCRIFCVLRKPRPKRRLRMMRAKPPGQSAASRSQRRFSFSAYSPPPELFSTTRTPYKFYPAKRPVSPSSEV